MKFYTYPFGTRIENTISHKSLPCMILIKDNWDDFGYRTLFYAHFIREDSTIVKLGILRILDTNENWTFLKNEFDNLDENYCSLGSSMDYYEKLGNEGREIYENIFNSLRDAAYDREIRDKFENHEGFKDSLLRESSAINALENAKAVLEKLKTKFDCSFTYVTNVTNAMQPHEVDFKFEESDLIPFRIIAIIGKNGTGKTSVLVNLAKDLSEEYSTNLNKFFPKKPIFGKLITISYSAFGGFEKKKEIYLDDETYKNFGILDNNNVFSKDFMKENLQKSVYKILDFERTEKWINFLEEFSSEEFVMSLRHEILIKDNFEVLSNLSSGQRMIFEIITNIIGSIRKNSLIIFDEPEIHLHPNAIAMLMKVLYSVLDEYESFAIIATHVPQVIQQIPSKSVIVFDREGDIPIVTKLQIESFGENLTTITNEIFQTMNVFDNYKDVLRSLAKSMSYDEVNRIFSNKLPMNAKIFLKSQYK